VALDGLGEDDGNLPAALAARLAEYPADTPCLVYAWRPDIALGSTTLLEHAVEAAARTSGRLVELALCRHPAGPPICWCRPPLPALLLAFARRHGVDFRASTLLGASATDRAIARVLHAAFAPSGEARSGSL
jgi:hypothetical protein